MELLDKKDKRLLYALELHGRRSESELAKKIGLSREVVRYRLKKLERQGIIRYHMTLVNTLNLGYLMFRTYYKFTGLSKAKEKELITFMQKHVNWVTIVEGRWNLTTMNFSKDVFEFQSFMDKLKQQFGEYIQDYWVSTMTGLYHYRRGFLIDKKDDYFIKMGSRKNRPTLDLLDKQILSTLLENGRMSYVEIGKRLKQNAKLIRDRMNRLKKDDVILGFTPFLNMSKLGMLYYKVHFKLKNYSPESYRSLLRYALQHPNIVFTVEAVGGADLELEIQVKDNNHLYSIIHDIRENFNFIHDYYFMEYTKEHTLDYLPRAF